MPATSHAPNWDWRYDADSDRLAALYAKANDEQWHADHAVDWSRSIDPGRPLLSPHRFLPLGSGLYDALSPHQQERLMAGLTSLTFSQLLHGEQGALIVSAKLVTATPRSDLKLAAAVQTQDEARHLAVFNRYVRRLGDIFPPTPPLRRVLDRIASHPLWQAQMVGMQIVVEGLALATFLDVREAIACPVLQDLLALVIKDEARHVAFGKLALRSHLAAMPPDERQQLDDFIRDLLADFRGWGTHPEDLINYAQVLTGADIDPTDAIRAIRRDVDQGRHLDLSRGMRYALAGLILPGLEQLGLIDPAAAAGLRATLPDSQDDLASLERHCRALDQDLVA